MSEFYQLLSLMVSLAGFVIVAGKLLLHGECLLSAAGKGVLAFIALRIALGALGAVFKLATGSEPHLEDADGGNADRS